MKKVLLFGAAGMLGTDMYAGLMDTFAVIPVTRQEVDITKKEALRAALEDYTPDLVVNCTAYTNVDQAEEEKDLAFTVNADAVKNMAELTALYHIPFFTYSTDYVFSGDQGEGYEEDDQYAPINVYGASKAKGEEEALLANPQTYILRTAWLYGAHGKNFVHTMLELGKKHGAVQVVNDQWGSPTWTMDVVKATKHLLETLPTPGIYHTVNTGKASWYEFAEEIFHDAGLDVRVTPIPSTQLTRRAKRPTYSLLKNTKTAPLPHWKDALRQYLGEQKGV